MKLLALHFDDKTIVTIQSDSWDEDYETLVYGDWAYPYPNTIQDSFVYGLIEGWTQGDSYLSQLIYEKGIPNRVILTEEVFSE
jgi:hypothetical protein